MMSSEETLSIKISQLRSRAYTFSCLMEFSSDAVLLGTAVSLGTAEKKQKLRLAFLCKFTSSRRGRYRGSGMFHFPFVSHQVRSLILLTCFCLGNILFLVGIKNRQFVVGERDV